MQRHSVLLATLALAGCASGPQIPPGTICEVTAASAQFYKYGPAQSFGPDEGLPRGTRVKLLSREFGFSRVVIGSGLTGYVANDQLNPLPPEPARKPTLVAAKNKKPRTFAGPIKRSNVQPTPDDPLFDVNDVPLPMKEEQKKP
jgi:hypothetical protein